MIIPTHSNPAAQALALMIQKGGPIRLRLAELAPMMQFAIEVEPNPRNPEVIHFTTLTREDVAKKMMAALAQAAAAPTEPTKESDDANRK